MKTFQITLFSLLLFNTVAAQNAFLDYKMALKLYNQTSFEKHTNLSGGIDSTSPLYRDTEKSFQLILPSLAFQWKTKGNDFHEIELGNVRAGQRETKTEEMEDPMTSGQVVNGVNVKVSSFAIRYEYILNFNKNKETKFVPSLGFGAGTYYSREKREPVLSNFFPTTQSQIGVKFFIHPRMTYYMNSKWFLDFNLPICLVDMNNTAYFVENPAFTPNQQRSATFNLTSFPKIFSGRIGIGMKI